MFWVHIPTFAIWRFLHTITFHRDIKTQNRTQLYQVCFAQTAALGGFCAEGWATGEETYGLSEWRSRRKWCNIATGRKLLECNIFPCKIYAEWCFGTYQTDPECFLGAILAQDSPEHRFVMICCRFGVPFWRSKMVEKSIPKSRHFQASLETLFFTIGDPKSAKTRFQN